MQAQSCLCTLLVTTWRVHPAPFRWRQLARTVWKEQVAESTLGWRKTNRASRAGEGEKHSTLSGPCNWCHHRWGWALLETIRSKRTGPPSSHHLCWREFSSLTGRPQSVPWLIILCRPGLAKARRYVPHICPASGIGRARLDGEANATREGDIVHCAKARVAAARRNLSQPVPSKRQ